MADVDAQLDKAEELANEGAWSYKAEPLAQAIEGVAKIQISLAESLKKFDLQFDTLSQELHIEAEEAEVYKWDYLRPIIYRIQRAQETIDTIRSFLLSDFQDWERLHADDQEH